MTVEMSTPVTLPARTDALPEVERGLSAAAADVEHALAFADRETVHDDGTEARELGVEVFLQPYPTRTALLVPVGDLLGVRSRCLESIHGENTFHGHGRQSTRRGAPAARRPRAASRFRRARS